MVSPSCGRIVRVCAGPRHATTTVRLVGVMNWGPGGSRPIAATATGSPDRSTVPVAMPIPAAGGPRPIARKNAASRIDATLRPLEATVVSLVRLVQQLLTPFTLTQARARCRGMIR